MTVWPCNRPPTRWDVTDEQLQRLGSITAKIRRSTGETVYVVDGDEGRYYDRLADAVAAIEDAPRE